MRIALLYPPPWKIPMPGQAVYPSGEGAPTGLDPTAVLNSDLIQAPYGILSVAAQAIHAGHDVTVINISNFPWSTVRLLVAHLDADIYGMSCLTANRRGVAMTAELIRSYHPDAHITVGGPHVTALPLETLAHCDAIDTVVMGEGERTFLQMLQQLEDAKFVEGICGLAWRSAGGCRLRPPDGFIHNLDTLVPPTRYFHLRTLLTSRGCPMDCTYCGSNLMWGRQLRTHSVEYVLDMIETCVRDYGQQIIAIKDDTFTINPKRVLAICEGIRSRKLEFMWSCETRADCLDEEVLGAMRAAGCKRISLGVESASRIILRNIRKRIDPAQVLHSTRSAKKFGLQVRYYMMAGNRGETMETFQQSMAFIRKARPSQFVFTQLHLYPGTEEFRLFEKSGVVSNTLFFDRDFLCLTCFAGRREDAYEINARVRQLEGKQDFWHYSAADCRAAMDRLPPLHSLHMDLCAAYLREGKPDLAEGQLRRAVAMEYFLPGLVDNHRACIAALRGDIHAVQDHLEAAAAQYPHRVVLQNLVNLERWMAEPSGGSSRPLQLTADLGFETTCVWRQPEFPDPLNIHLRVNESTCHT